MGKPNPNPATNPAPDWQTLTDAFQKLYDCLNEAYNNATSTQAAARIHDLTLSINDILHQVNQSELLDKREEYQKLSGQIKAVSADLANFRENINDLISDIRTATGVANAIEGATILRAIDFGDLENEVDKGKS